MQVSDPGVGSFASFFKLDFTAGSDHVTAVSRSDPAVWIAHQGLTP